MLKRDQFLNVPVVLTAWNKVTIRDFVKFSANKAGGVHYDEAPDETTVKLNALMRAVDDDETPIFANTMASIVAITLQALHPLREHIRSEAK